MEGWGTWLYAEVAGRWPCRRAAVGRAGHAGPRAGVAGRRVDGVLRPTRPRVPVLPSASRPAQAETQAPLPGSAARSARPSAAVDGDSAGRRDRGASRVTGTRVAASRLVRGRPEAHRRWRNCRRRWS